MRQALVVTDFVPAGDRDGAAWHALTQVRALRAEGWAVTVVAEGMDPEDGPRVAALAAQEIEVWAGPDAEGIGDAYLEDRHRLLAEAPFDLVVVHFWLLAELWLPLVRATRPGAAVLVDMIDLHALRLLRERLGDDGPGLSSVDALELARELGVYARADGVIAVSEQERDLTDLLTGRDGLAHHVPIGHPVPPLEALPPVEGREGLLFVGNCRHPPNVEAARDLVDRVLPHLEDPRLDVVGYALEAGFGAWLEAHPGVRAVGWTPELRPYLDRARVFAAPLRSGAGVKNKLLVAMAAGLPVVTTTVGAEGMGIEPGVHADVEDDPAAFAAAVERLLTDDALWAERSAAAHAWVAEHHDRAHAEAAFLDACARVLGAASR